jgi:hypothetical protein
MRHSDFVAECNSDIRALVRRLNYCPRGYGECEQGCAYPGRCHSTDHDLGPFRDVAGDPREVEDERDFAELTDEEKRERLTELPHDELVGVALNFAEDAAMWEWKARRIAAMGNQAMRAAVDAVRAALKP